MLTPTAISAKPLETTLEAGPKSIIPIDSVRWQHHTPTEIEEAIRHRACLKWVARGKPNGNGVSFWQEAEKELLMGK